MLSSVGFTAPACYICPMPLLVLMRHGESLWNFENRFTGSCGFSTNDLFVPTGFTFDMPTMQPQRGGPLYNIELPGLVVNELAGFALGVGRRVLDTIIELAQTKRRGYAQQVPLPERAVFQHSIGESDLRLRAARSLVIEVMEKAWCVQAVSQEPSYR